MEPPARPDSGSNPFDIATLLRRHRQQLRSDIAHLSIRPHACRAPPPSSPERRHGEHEPGRAQKKWERLRKKILHAQHGGNFSYRLRNLEELRETVQFTEDELSGILPQNQSPIDVDGSSRALTEEARERAPSDVYSPDPVDSIEGLRSPPLSPAPSESPASPETPASLVSPPVPTSPNALKSNRAGSSGSQAEPTLSQSSLLRTRKSSEISRTTLDSIVFREKREPVKKTKEKKKHHHRSSQASSGRNSREYDSSMSIPSKSSPELSYNANENPQQGCSENDEVLINERMHASLDRLTKIINEMGLLLSTTVYPSTVLQQRRDEDSCITKFMTSATATQHGMPSQTSGQLEQEVHEPSMSSGEVLPPEAVETHPSRNHSRSKRLPARDSASSSPEYSRGIGKKGGKHLKPQRRRGGPNKRIVRVAKDVLTDSSEENSDVALPDDVPNEIPRRPDNGINSASLHPQDTQSTSAASQRAASQRARNQRAGNRRAYNALVGGSFPQLPARQLPSHLSGDDLGANRRASEAASIRQTCLSPGELPDNMLTESIDYIPEPVAPEWRSEGELEPEFRRAGRGVRWCDRGRRFSTDVYRASVPATASDETRAPRSWLPLQESARETGPSQHIWRYADSYSDRVYDEAAQRRAEVCRTTFGGNIGGQPPHMRASRVRLASYPSGSGRRMCQVKIVCIITPIKEEDATASSNSDAGVGAARPPNRPQARPP